MSKGKLAIIGVGEVPTGIYPERSRWDIIYDSCIEAARDAGIDKNDVEGVVTVAPQAQPRLTSEISFGKIPEELGLKGCKDVCICNAGGASTSNCLRMAEQWIHSGLAKFVLIPHVTVQSTIPIPKLITITTPKCTRSIPTLSTRGRKIGIKIKVADNGSRTVPHIIKKIFKIINTTHLLAEMDVNSSTRASPNPIFAIIQANSPMTDTIIRTMAELSIEREKVVRSSRNLSPL